MAVLYISNNDGTDTRIQKEIKSISGRDEVYFIGNGQLSEKNINLISLCKGFKLMQSRRNSIGSILTSYFWIIRFLIKDRITSVHVVNEQLMVFYFPLMFLPVFVPVILGTVLV